MILGTKVRYAVMAMAELASRDAHMPVSLADLAESQEITVPYLEQIFAKLKHAGLVKSVRGPGGGYILASSAADITMADIAIAVEESMKMTRCENQSDQGCMATRTRCATHHLWEGLERQIMQYLGSVNLSQLAKGKAGNLKHSSIPALQPFTHG